MVCIAHLFSSLIEILFGVLVLDLHYFLSLCIQFHDLTATSKSNSLIEFADDCTLLVPANIDVSAENELSNIMSLIHLLCLD